MLISLLQFFVALIVFVCIHEMGHVIAARICGYRQARFHLMHIKDGKVTLAVTDAPLHLFSDQQNIWISLAGVLGTRLMAELMLLSGATLNLLFSPSLTTFWISLFVLLRTDLLLYTLRNTLARFVLHTPQDDQDISLTARYLHKTTRRPEALWFAVIGSISVLDLMAGWNRVAGFVFDVLG